jgi:3-oxoadipate enol-lactonase
MSTVSLHGITIGYDDKGTDDALVLVHGHPFDRTMWWPQLDRFGRTHRVVMADLRGYGESTVARGKNLLETFALDLAGLPDHLGIERFVLGGLSMGGQIVMACHQLFPHRIAGLVLAATSAPAETLDDRRMRTETANRLLRVGLGPYIREALRKMVAPGGSRHRRTRPDDDAQHPARGCAAALRGRAERPDYLGLLTTVTVPTLVVVGSEDEFTPLRDTELIHQKVPDSRLAVVEGAAHLPNLERPTEFNRASRAVGAAAHVPIRSAATREGALRHATTLGTRAGRPPARASF